MPSIPQSLLWISLVVLWLFVLVPMLVSKRDAVRRTSDIALATRVLNGGAAARLLRRSGPAAGHASDPTWQPEESSLEEDWDDEPTDRHPVIAEADGEAEAQDWESAPVSATPASGPIAVRVAAVDTDSDNYLDVDVVEDSAAARALPGAPAAPVGFEAHADETEMQAQAEQPADDHPGVEPDYARPAGVPGSSRQRRFDTSTAEAVSARKYAFRRRVLMVMAAILVVTAFLAFEVTSTAWWACGIATTATVLYLGYLRRQTRIEEKVRNRRQQRMARARHGVESTYDREYDVVPSRLRRPGAVVLEIDDEDPVFEHLEYANAHRGYGYPRGMGYPRDIPRAVGQ